MRTFFYISPLFRQCYCHKQQFFFFILFKFIPTFFPPQFWQWHCHKLCTFFFLFLFTTLQNKNIVLVFRIYVLFFFFCLHHFRIRILYLNLQCVSQNKNIVLEITLSVYQGTLTIKERDKPNCFDEKLTICVLFFYYIFPLFQQCHCHKLIATIFFLFHPIQIHSHIYFFLRNDMCSQFLQQILSVRLLLLD